MKLLYLVFSIQHAILERLEHDYEIETSHKSDFSIIKNKKIKGVK